MSSVEDELRELRAELARLAAKVSGLPTTLTKKRTCLELSVSPRKLSGMIAHREILTVLVGKTVMVPASEVIRLGTPVPAIEPKRKASPPRPRPRVVAKSEADKIRALRKKKR
jgi:hypothetical protein